MMETRIPQQDPEPLSLEPVVSSAQTLDNDVILASPTPIDLDPPPLVDVKPLSQPVATQSVAEPEPELVSVPEVPVPVMPEPRVVLPEVEPKDAFVEPLLESVKPVSDSVPPLEPYADDVPELTLPVAEEDPDSLPELELEPLAEEPPLMDVPDIMDESPEEKSMGLPPLLLNPEPEELPPEREESDLPPVTEPVIEESDAFPDKSITPEEVLSHVGTEQPVSAEAKSEGYVKNEFFVSEGAEDPWILPWLCRARIHPQPEKVGSQTGHLEHSYFGVFLWWNSTLGLSRDCLVDARNHRRQNRSQTRSKGGGCRSLRELQ